ncbi:MAG: cysteine desulfurase family protein [Acidimicrobiia bacterium]|nr:cysteine desulfurase family protein [Acidimicrobiia bacterium]
MRRARSFKLLDRGTIVAHMLYLDHAATTPMRPEVWEAMAPYAGEVYGNASGSHGAARLAKNALEEARERAARLLGARPLEIVFTGGGTESDNLALQGAALAGRRRGGVVTTAIEHEAVLETAAFLTGLGCRVDLVGVDRMGRVDPKEVAGAVGGDTAVVSIMAANNETGVVQPVRKVSEAVKAANPEVAVHTDAVQSFISQDLNVDDLGADMVSLAAHKFGGPKGVGLLYVRTGVGLEPILHGGGQELGRRSGTHNVMGAVGMVQAMELAASDRERFVVDVGEARRRFEEGLRVAIPDLEVNAPLDGRLVQHSHVRIPGVRNETLLVRLDQRGLAASAGSSCQSGAATVSHVLAAMGFDDEPARQCLRVSFGWTTTPQDGDDAAAIVAEAVQGLR